MALPLLFLFNSSCSTDKITDSNANLSEDNLITQNRSADQCSLNKVRIMTLYSIYLWFLPRSKVVHDIYLYLYICPSGIVFKNIEHHIDTTLNNCGYLYNVYESLAQAGNYTYLRTLLNNMYRIATNKIEGETYPTLNPLKYPCGNVPFISTVIANSCITYCSKTNKYGLSQIVPTPCGTGCCIRTTAFCFDNGKVITQDPGVIHNQDCISGAER
ncbi:MAG: hypothetical protein IPO92_08095 [Saprospiraceae bacterium]|nr:hypothetical protein [Saprospiraceae bacterium]